MEHWEEFTHEHDLAVHQGEVEVDGKAGGPEEGAQRGGGCDEALDLAEVGEDTAFTGLGVEVYGVVDGTKDVS